MASHAVHTRAVDFVAISEELKCARETLLLQRNRELQEKLDAMERGKEREAEGFQRKLSAYGDWCREARAQLHQYSETQRRLEQVVKAMADRLGQEAPELAKEAMEALSSRRVDIGVMADLAMPPAEPRSGALQWSPLRKVELTPWPSQRRRLEDDLWIPPPPPE